jgi:host factor-I protein
MTKTAGLQDDFLKRLQQENSFVAIFLVNGIKLQGQIQGFDSEVILLKNNTTQLIFKHAISTIAEVSAAT